MDPTGLVIYENLRVNRSLLGIQHLTSSERTLHFEVFISEEVEIKAANQHYSYFEPILNYLISAN
jgi:hypothetical protein